MHKNDEFMHDGISILNFSKFGINSVGESSLICERTIQKMIFNNIGLLININYFEIPRVNKINVILISVSFHNNKCA
jgi:hypothetical protein